MTIEELRKADLNRRRHEFAAMLGVPTESVAHLQFCSTCGGNDYQWTDVTMSYFEGAEIYMFDQYNIAHEAAGYRAYLAETACKDCAATGFEGGQNYVSDNWR